MARRTAQAIATSKAGSTSNHGAIWLAVRLKTTSSRSAVFCPEATSHSPAADCK